MNCAAPGRRSGSYSWTAKAASRRADSFSRKRGALGAGPSVLCLDNADGIEGLSEAIDEIARNYATTIFVAGKSAGFARELDRKLSAKPGTIDIKPLSYREFLEYRGLDDSRLSLALYAKTGGLPETGMIATDSPYLSQFIRMIADSFLLTGIIEPNQIRNPGHIRKLLELVARSGGETLPARAICASFTAERLTISPQAALDYLGLCRDSGLIAPVRVLDIDRKKNIDAGEVWYFADSGLRAAFVQKKEPGRSRPRVREPRVPPPRRLRLDRRAGTSRLGPANERVGVVRVREGWQAHLRADDGQLGDGQRTPTHTKRPFSRSATPGRNTSSIPTVKRAENDGIRQVYLRDLLAGRTGYAELA